MQTEEIEKLAIEHANKSYDKDHETRVSIHINELWLNRKMNFMCGADAVLQMVDDRNQRIKQLEEDYNKLKQQLFVEERQNEMLIAELESMKQALHDNRTEITTTINESQILSTSYQKVYSVNEVPIKFVIQEIPNPENEILKLKKEVNRLTLEKVAMIEFYNSVVDELPTKKKKEFFDRKLSTFGFVRDVDISGELPYPNI